jgi:hypothetical protein
VERGVAHLGARLPLLIILVGTLLRLLQYFGNRSLWRDEAALARGILALRLSEWFQPLDHAQVAPPLFVLIQRTVIAAVGGSEAALRLFPLIAALAGLPLFWQVASRLLPHRSALMALAFVAVSPRLIYYASEVKQYSSDVTVALGLVLLALWVHERGVTGRRALLLGLAGGTAVWLSQPAVFFLPGAALFLGLSLWKADRWDELRRLALSMGLWALLGLPALLLALASVDAQLSAFMSHYWSTGFMPLPPTSAEDLRWLRNAARAFLLDAAGIRDYRLAAMLVAVGATWAAYQRRADILLLLGAPLLFTLLASGLELYPFGTLPPRYRGVHAGDGRVLLFLVPSAFMFVAAGAEGVGALLRRRVRGAAYILPLLVLLPLATVSATRLPHYREDVRPVIEYYLAHREPGDRLYVYARSEMQFEYYAHRFNIAPDEYFLGSHDRLPPETLLREVASLIAEGRTWLLFNRNREVDGVEARAYITRFLDSVASKRDEVQRGDQYLYLYEPGPHPQPSSLSAGGAAPAAAAVRPVRRVPAWRRRQRTA